MLSGRTVRQTRVTPRHLFNLGKGGATWPQGRRLARVLPGCMVVRPTNMSGEDRTGGYHEDEGEAHLLVQCAGQKASIHRAQGGFSTSVPVDTRTPRCQAFAISHVQAAEMSRGSNATCLSISRPPVSWGSMLPSALKNGRPPFLITTQHQRPGTDALWATRRD